MNRSLFLAASGLTVVLLACSGATRDESLDSSEADLAAQAKTACESKACGESCTLCPPGATNCFETMEIKQCNAEGSCSSAPAECALDGGPAPDADDGNDIDGGPAPYEPCAGKVCGDGCSVCDPSDPNCFETAVLKFCHAGGECLPSPPACAPPPPYQPCAGKACGDACSVCDPSDPNCFETAVLKFCSESGVCTANAVVCK